jgi:hypothetical protein
MDTQNTLKELSKQPRLQSGGIPVCSVLKALQLSENHADLLRPVNEINKALASIQTYTKVNLIIPGEFGSALRKAAIGLHATVDAMNQSGFIKEIWKFNKQWELYIQSHSGTISRILENFQAIQRSLTSVRLEVFACRAMTLPTFQQAFLERLKTETLPVNANTDMVLSNQQILDAIEDSIPDSNQIKKYKSFELLISNMFARWNKLHPDLRTAIISLFVGLFFYILGIQSVSSSQIINKTEIKEYIEKVRNATYNIVNEKGISSQVLCSFRIVIKDNLPVFISHRKKSGRMGVLRIGQVVTVKFKKRNWTKVEWLDPITEEIQSGWVFTRYLKKIQ